MGRLGVIAAAIVFTVGVAHADALTYELVAMVGPEFGSKPVGTITFADGASGSIYDIATAGTEFDLGIVGWPVAIPRWISGDPGVSANGVIHFDGGVIGDAVLTPFQDGTGPGTGPWAFEFDEDPADFPLPDRVLLLFGDNFGSEWAWQDLAASPDFVGEFPGQLNGVEWELHLVPIPEPGSAVLCGIALAGALVRRRRKRNT